MLRNKEFYINLLHQNSEYIRSEFGVSSMQLFGSVARGENTTESDVDIFVEMPPKLFIKLKMKSYLEQLFQKKVDIVRKHRNLNPFLLNEIKRDGIIIFQ